MKLSIALLLLIQTSCSSISFKKKILTSKNGFKVSYLDYPAKKPLSQPRTVIIFPPTGGVTYLEKSYAKQLVQRGADVKVLSHWTGLKTNTIELSLHQDLHEKAMQAFALVLNSVAPQQSVSVIGTSLGGIFTTIALNKFDRISHAVAIAAGNPIPEVIAYSQHSSMKNLRQKRFETMSFSGLGAYAQAIDKVFFLDPQDLSPLYKDKKRALVVLKNDLAVPTMFQMKLNSYWQPQKTIYIGSNHLWGIIKSWWYHSSELCDFLIYGK